MPRKQQETKRVKCSRCGHTAEVPLRDADVEMLQVSEAGRLEPAPLVWRCPHMEEKAGAVQPCGTRNLID